MAIVDLEMFNHFVLKRSAYDETIRYVRAAGRRSVECVVVWSGLPIADHFVIDTMICPHQFATAIGSRVAAEDVDEMYEQLYRKGRVAVAQTHSHPGEAFHSDTDDHFSLVTRCGTLSLVIPDFGFGETADMKCWAGFRLRSSGWERIVPTQLITLEKP
jgi:hypothetical protein